MKESGAERRREQRRPAHGEARLRLAGAMSEPFTGRLLDLSTRGFRVRHTQLNLASGERVEFEIGGRTGVARAIWNRIVDREAETGFSVIERDQ